IGEGQLPINAIETLIAQKDRSLAPATAPSDGLYFVGASYPDEFQKHLPDLPLGPTWLNLP
ncbi:MAG: tRNA pseudouridine(38-40) synthase TruA, partial [Moraxella sp.]|nr:tRNA pseudouridine(38-40) synthase TruA [Moraxella sp.]